jgi:hypothetical protein
VIRTIARRLKQLETKAAVHSVPFEPHTIVFVDVQKRVTSTMGWENGKLVRTVSAPMKRRPTACYRRLASDIR